MISGTEWTERQMERRSTAIDRVRAYLDRLEQSDRRAEIRIDAPDLIDGTEVTGFGDPLARLEVTVPEGPPR